MTGSNEQMGMIEKAVERFAFGRAGRCAYRDGLWAGRRCDQCGCCGGDIPNKGPTGLQPADCPCSGSGGGTAARPRSIRWLQILAENFWPGPLTLVFPKQKRCPVAAAVTAGLDTIAVTLSGASIDAGAIGKIGPFPGSPISEQKRWDQPDYGRSCTVTVWVTPRP